MICLCIIHIHLKNLIGKIQKVSPVKQVSMNKNRIGVFADKPVGIQTLKFLWENYPEDLQLIVCTDINSDIYKEVIRENEQLKSITIFNNDLSNNNTLNKLKQLDLDY